MTVLDGPVTSAFHYPEGVHGPASLMYAGPIPLLHVSGRPEEIATQVVALALRPAVRLLDYPLDLLANHFRSRLIARLAVRPLDRLGNRLLPQFPPAHRRELTSIAGLMGDARRVFRANTLLDLKNSRHRGDCSVAPASRPLLAAAGPAGRSWGGTSTSSHWATCTTTAC